MRGIMSNSKILKKPAMICFFRGSVHSNLKQSWSPALIKTVPNGTTPVQSQQQRHQKTVDAFTLAFLLLT